MRADVMASQFYCTEAEWQAEPMKRLTHWSLGDGVGWMRPPDKNCVQPGSVEGGFYGTGVGSASPLLGTAVLDTLQGHAHEVHAAMSVVSNTSSGQMPMNNGAPVKTNMVAKTIISDGVNGDPRVAAITKPRTWHGIWMIRMYGRVTNAGDLNAPALNARMDMLDARLAAWEGASEMPWLKAMLKRKWLAVDRLANVNYTNDTPCDIEIRVRSNTGTNNLKSVFISVSDDGGATWIVILCATDNSTANPVATGGLTVPPGYLYKFNEVNGANCWELRYVA